MTSNRPIYEEAGGVGYTRTLKRGRRTILLSVAAFAALGTLINLVTPSIYRATARIEMRRPVERSTWVGQPMSTGNYQSENVALSTDASLITNRGLLSQLAVEMNTPGTRLAEASRGHERGLGQTAFKWLAGSGANASTVAAAASESPDPGPSPAQLDWLARIVRVEPVKDTRLVDVHVEDTSPQLAQELDNRLVQLFVAYQSRRSLESDTLGMAALAARLGVRPGEDVGAASSSDPRVTSVAQATARRARLTQSIAGLNDALVRARTSRIELQSRIAHAGRGGAVYGTDAGSNMSDLRKQIADKQVELAAARQVYRDKHPKVVELLTELDALKGRVREESSYSVGALRAEARALAAQEASLSGALSAAEGQLGAVETDAEGHTVDERQRVADETVYQQMLSRMRGGQTNDPVASPAVAIVDPAAVDVKPVRPHRLLNLVTCMVAGALVGAGIVLARAGSRTLLRGPSDVEALLGVPVLAEIGRNA